MKIKIVVLVFVCFLTCWSGRAQTEELSSNHWSIFSKLVDQKSYQKAVEEGIGISLSFTQNRAYQEAFATCRQLDALITRVESESGEKQYQLRYLVGKERLRIYMRLKNVEQSDRYLEQLRDCLQELKSDSLKEDFYLTEAQCYHQLGLTEKSFDSYKRLFDFRSLGKDNIGKEACYKEMISHAEATNNPSLAIAMRKLYGSWQDSIKAVEDAIQLEILANEQVERQQEIESKDHKIQTQFYIIMSCVVVAALLLVALIYVSLLLLRVQMQRRKLKLAMATLTNTNAQKSKLISNIAAQIEPSILLIEEEVSTVLPVDSRARLSLQAIKRLVNGIEGFVVLESTKEEKYPVENLSISNLCKEVMEEAKVDFNEGVIAVVNTPPHVMLKTNEEVVKKILLHLLNNASRYTTEGKITLEFKKRRADSGQFIVTDTGIGIAPNEMGALFTPFSKVYDLLDGSGLGLPTCALMAQKLNGGLSVDPNYKKGARFIFELYA